jgi:hypothetical protein
MDKPLNQDSYAPILAFALAPTPKPKPENAPSKYQNATPSSRLKPANRLNSVLHRSKNNEPAQLSKTR